MKLSENGWTDFSLQKKERKIGEQKFYEIHLKKVAAKKVKVEAEEPISEKQIKIKKFTENDIDCKNRDILSLSAILIDDLANVTKVHMKGEKSIRKVKPAQKGFEICMNSLTDLRMIIDG